MPATAAIAVPATEPRALAIWEALALTADQAPDMPDDMDERMPAHVEDALAPMRSHMEPVELPAEPMSDLAESLAFLHLPWNSSMAEEARDMPDSKSDASAVIVADSA
jgi:hypothetical protein